jgi:hypothetical protein
MRRAKAARVHDSLKEGRGHDANQGEVWNEVAACLSMSAAESPTHALSDSYAKRDHELTEFRSTLRMPEEAVGVAVFHGGKFQGLDLFDRHSTLKYFWASLIDSYAIDFLSAPMDPAAPSQSAEGNLIRQHLERAVNGLWENFPSPGEGSDWRLGDNQLTGAALIWDEKVVIHLQLFSKPGQGVEPQMPNYRPRIRRRYGSSPPPV